MTAADLPVAGEIQNVDPDVDGRVALGVRLGGGKHQLPLGVKVGGPGVLEPGRGQLTRYLSGVRILSQPSTALNGT